MCQNSGVCHFRTVTEKFGIRREALKSIPLVLRECEVYVKMSTGLCRFCANSTRLCRMTIQLTNSKLNVEEKLIACCQWKKYKGDDDLPNTICCTGYKTLQKCWLFSESIACAQEKLRQIYRNIETTAEKHEIKMNENESNLSEAESDHAHIFVKPIKAMTPEPAPESSTNQVMMSDQKMHHRTSIRQRQSKLTNWSSTRKIRMNMDSRQRLMPPQIHRNWSTHATSAARDFVSEVHEMDIWTSFCAPNLKNKNQVPHQIYDKSRCLFTVLNARKDWKDTWTQHKLFVCTKCGRLFLTKTKCSALTWRNATK